MEPVLDETSIVPCATRLPGARVQTLAEALRALDALGGARVLRTTKDAADREIRGGQGLRFWCFDRATNRDAGRFVAFRLSREPFIDGAGGLFSVAEGTSAVQAACHGMPVVGLGLAALTDTMAIAVECHDHRAGGPVLVTLTRLTEDALVEEEGVEVLCLVCAADTESHRPRIVANIDRAVSNGLALLARFGDLFPSLRMGPRARDQIGELTGREISFRQLLRHLRALDIGARDWAPGTQFSPAGGLSWSLESKPTLSHGEFGPMRDFPVPDGFPGGRFSLHTKLTGGAGSRLYFRPERAEGKPAVIIGYFGPHLPTVLHKF